MATGIRFPDDMVTAPQTLADNDKLLISDSVDAKKAKWWDLLSVKNWLFNVFSKVDASNVSGADKNAWQTALNIAFLTDSINDLTAGDAYQISLNGFYYTDATTANLPNINKVGILRTIITPTERYLTYLTVEGGRLVMWANRYDGTTWGTWNALSGGAAIDVTTDTTNFVTLLSNTDTDVQKALDTLDKHVHSTLSQPDGTNPFVYTDNGGALHIDGDIIQNGVAYETHVEQVFSKNDLIITRDGAVGGLGTGEYTGIQANLYDGVNSGQLVFDKDGWARVGDVGNLLKLATITENPTDAQVVRWDAATSTLVSIPFGTVAGTISEGNHTHALLHQQNTDYKIEKYGTPIITSNTTTGTYGAQFTVLYYIATANTLLSSIKVFLDTVNQTSSVANVVIDIYDHEFGYLEVLSAGTAGNYLTGQVYREEGFTITAGNASEIWNLSNPFPVANGNKYSIVIYSQASPLYGKELIYFDISSDASGMVQRYVGSDGTNIVADPNTSTPGTTTNLSYEITLQSLAKVQCDTTGLVNVTGIMRATQTPAITSDLDYITKGWADINKEDTFTKNTAFNKNFGTVAGTVAEGNHNHVGVYANLSSVNNFTKYQNTFLDIRLGDTTSGYTGSIGVKNMAGTGDGTTLGYTTYLTYDLFYDNVNDNWVAYRGTLGRKQLLLIGYHDDGFKFMTADPAKTTYTSADFTKIMHVVGSTKRVAIGDILPTEKLEVVGNIKASGTITGSDIRLKTDINPLNKGIDGLNPVSYRLKDTGEFYYGFIAQEMLKTHPELVKGTGKEREDGTIDYYGIKQDAIIPLLVKDAQDKDIRIKELEQRVILLEKTV